MTTKTIFIIGALMAGISVAAGAFGAHALAERLDDRMLEVWNTAAQYQMYHGLGLLGVAWLSQQTEHVATTVAGVAFIVGIVLFSGSLYVMALSGIRWLGAITPIGGVGFLVGWIACIVAALRI